MLPKSNWPAFVKTLNDAGLIFRASLSPKKNKALQNRDHINVTTFDILLSLNVAICRRDGQIATKSDARQLPLFGLASVKQVKNNQIGKTHMLTIAPDVTADVESWGLKSLQQRYPNKKVGHPDSELDDAGHPVQTIFIICACILL
jgi:hypothetical protein